MVDTVVINTSELCLKGGNRPFFEKRLLENIRCRLDGVAGLRILRRQGSLALEHHGPLASGQVATISSALATVFGIGHWYFAVRCPKEMSEIERKAAEAMLGQGERVFKVETTRSDKRFPLDSMAISRQVGAHVLAAVPGASVNVKEPRVTVAVRIEPEHALVSVGRTDGLGGLPTGVSGAVAALLSGGIDSPVASWKAMRRGCRVVFVHFHSYPYVGAASIEKVRRLVEVLDGYQRGSRLYLVPLADAQREIAAKADPSMRIILYRRMMLRIAERIARSEGALATVTGDSIGQVASQTLENMATVSAVAAMPVFRPLIGDDKEDIVTLARRIGTYGISIERQDDCCSMFMPPRPVIRSTVARAEAEESRYDVDGLVDAAARAAERSEYGASRVAA